LLYFRKREMKKKKKISGQTRKRTTHWESSNTSNTMGILFVVSSNKQKANTLSCGQYHQQTNYDSPNKIVSSQGGVLKYSRQKHPSLRHRMQIMQKKYSQTEYSGWRNQLMESVVNRLVDRLKRDNRDCVRDVKIWPLSCCRLEAGRWAAALRPAGWPAGWPLTRSLNFGTEQFISSHIRFSGETFSLNKRDLAIM
jgi:hypothetical protein